MKNYLHSAMMKQDGEGIRYLMSLGVNGQAILEEAIRKDKIESIKALLEFDTLAIRDSYFLTAFYEEKPETLILLIERAGNNFDVKQLEEEVANTFAMSSQSACLFSIHTKAYELGEDNEYHDFIAELDGQSNALANPFEDDENVDLFYVKLSFWPDRCMDWQHFSSSSPLSFSINPLKLALLAYRKLELWPPSLHQSSRYPRAKSARN